MAARPWMDDGASQHCLLCHQAFSFTNRRHHCRSCGRCVCQYCSPKNVEMASLQLKGEQRCCVACYEYLSKGRSSSLERVFSLLTRGAEEHTSSSFVVKVRHEVLNASASYALDEAPAPPPLQAFKRACKVTMFFSALISRNL